VGVIVEGVEPELYLAIVGSEALEERLAIARTDAPELLDSLEPQFERGAEQRVAWCDDYVVVHGGSSLCPNRADDSRGLVPNRSLCYGSDAFLFAGLPVDMAHDLGPQILIPHVGAQGYPQNAGLLDQVTR